MIQSQVTVGLFYQPGEVLDLRTSINETVIKHRKQEKA
jgi:hypothetical protein